MRVAAPDGLEGAMLLLAVVYTERLDGILRLRLVRAAPRAGLMKKRATDPPFHGVVRLL